MFSLFSSSFWTSSETIIDCNVLGTKRWSASISLKFSIHSFFFNSKSELLFSKLSVLEILNCSPFFNKSMNLRDFSGSLLFWLFFNLTLSSKLFVSFSTWIIFILVSFIFILIFSSLFFCSSFSLMFPKSFISLFWQVKSGGIFILFWIL